MIEVDAAGNVTIGGKAAFLTTTGELTTNNAAGTVPAASLTNILTATSKAAANDATLSIGGKVYNSSGTAGEVHYVDTKSKDAVLTAFKAGPVNSNVVLGDGLASVTLAFTSGQSTDTYVDDAGEFTKITGGTFSVQPGSLFPALHRLEEAGWLTSVWQPSENNRRAKYYALTAAGRRRLRNELSTWARFSGALEKIVNATERPA